MTQMIDCPQPPEQRPRLPPRGQWAELRAGPGCARIALRRRCVQHPCVLYLARRRGFIRLAQETGAVLVPCIAFGENRAFDTMATITSSNGNGKGGSSIVKSWLFAAQQALYNAFSFSTPILTWPFPRQWELLSCCHRSTTYRRASSSTRRH
jgi:hypothetical protein